MKTTVLKFAVILGVIVLVACKKKPEPSHLTVDEAPISVGIEGGEFTVIVKSNGNWFAVVESSESVDWCTLSNQTGTGDGAIIVAIAENTDILERSVIVKITMGDFTKRVQFNQGAADPFLTVDKTSITAIAEARIYSIAVNSNGEWIAVVEDADNHRWCEFRVRGVPSATSTGSGSGTIYVSVGQNIFEAPRSATVKITSGDLTKSVVINQKGDTIDYPDTFCEVISLGNCHWFNRNLDGEVIIINNEEELKKYVDCPAGSTLYPIDFSKNSLLLTSGVASVGIYDISPKIQLVSPNEYELNVTVKLNDIPEPLEWEIAVRTKKLSEGTSVNLNVEEVPTSVIGRWRLMKYGGSDCPQYNTVYEFKPNGDLTISGNCGFLHSGEYFYSINNYGKIDIWGVEFPYVISSEELILKKTLVGKSPYVIESHHFVKIN